jgi:hypothetical protein
LWHDGGASDPWNLLHQVPPHNALHFLVEALPASTEQRWRRYLATHPINQRHLEMNSTRDPPRNQAKA